MSEQHAAALEFLTHRREGAQIAGGGLHLLRPELVLAQFGEAFRGCFLRNSTKEIEPLRPPMGRRAWRSGVRNRPRPRSRDFRAFESDRGRRRGGQCRPRKSRDPRGGSPSTGRELRSSPFRTRRCGWAAAAPQSLRALGAPRAQISGAPHPTSAAPTMAHSTKAHAAAATAAMEVLMSPTGS